MSLFDLHLHSTSSDGELTPTELMAAASQAGITAVSLSDHDGVNGVEEAAEAAARLGMTFIPGVEFSVDFPSGEFHLLGYGIALREPLPSFLEKQQKSRGNRNAVMVERLNALGFALTLDDVLAQAQMQHQPGEPISLGRPHIAMAMVAKGYSSSLSEAFDLYLAKGKPAYAERGKITAKECIATIRKVGGVAVLAHPVTLGLSEAELIPMLSSLTNDGLEGIEALHSDHDLELQQTYRRLAASFGLLVTGGSDYHGPRVSPAVRLGYTKPDLPLDEMELVERLQERLASRS